MPSHHHRRPPYPTPPPSPDNYPVNHLGFRVPMDATAMDETLAIVMSYPEIEPYVAQTGEMAKQSKVWQKGVEGLKKVKGDDETRLAVAYAWGFLTGSSCAVTAVDAGLIEDSSGGSGNEFDGNEEGD